jgi:hypothetical protein
MFAKLAKSGLAKLWLVQPRRIAPGPHQSGLPKYCNDNLPDARRTRGPRRLLTPALTCHWLTRGGRLECCWHCESDDAPIGGLDEQQPSAATGRAFGRQAVSCAAR